MTGIDALLANAERYTETFRAGGLAIPPARELAVVACMDARLDLFDILGLEKGDAHLIRNAGGTVTPDVRRSLAVSQRRLHTRDIMLIHHTDCGMLTFTDDEFRAEVYEDVGLTPDYAVDSFTDLEDDVRQSALRIRADRAIPHRDRIQGFVYDVKTGRLHPVWIPPHTAGPGADEPIG
ncbi:beta-class carbonic anhydrase [Thermomonospora umbrina]|uniref:carbonic anhydrase n=1 Tax=Thermomonospora umbrina TaxID=111806 RepID=A0A3D9SSX7_9ACTN|nr:carbonic anhydrase [Thermomonospora umbrina]REE98707.1 carbonic anhydrase [Thermomonospora umbrina]